MASKGKLLNKLEKEDVCLLDVAACSLVEIDSVSENLTASVIRMDFRVIFYRTTWCNIPEDSHLVTRYCKNLKCQQVEEMLNFIDRVKMSVEFEKERYVVECKNKKNHIHLQIPWVN
jgi:hypothetical protein